MVVTNAAEILGVGTPELLIVLVIVLLIFGSKKLPELARSLGQSAKELRKGINDDTSNDKVQETDKLKKTDQA
ncbi:MAG TPA: twin-arginine translocase TatA/TatE family subunit [Patescibacteria group bacterium]|jgi:sec-independent protein translocase protein TatA|nr:twin-arginine translocase TatA/TatE family subunit [Patescibacteria group bacterium]